ncbi:hypothetical protein OPT61_g7638 [Boeremia exigua]|uniref:Uncharacterized protein n=1 Tax=Boeremia exigua TaxID=749465 RepID=A0ACC2I1R2_9PLEO|nr:hypothetical protein OPT61_g7638 [Boeremia exigua]
MNRTVLHSFSPSRGCAFASSLAAMKDLENSCELFEYTSGRWLYNEPCRLAERRLAFNVDELLEAAAKSVNKTTSDIKGFRKIAEGGFNRVFDISMKDGSSILARLPYPSTLPRHLAVASEAATLAFVRAHGIPTPRVLGYSADDNAVGAEYIFMEKLPGRPLGDAWFDLSEQQRLKVLLQIVKLETKLFAIDLPASGSIYYARPYVALQWWFGERGDLEIDRGPHEDSRLVLQTPAEKELAWIRAYGQHRFPFDRAYRETFDYKKQDPEEHAKPLVDYIRLAPHLVPTCSKLNLPVLRHPDLQPNNILISEDFSITGLIDWQHSTVLPTFLAAGMPNMFQNYDDDESMLFVPPQLPDDFESLDEHERVRAQEQFRRRHIHFFYLGFTQRMNGPHWRALQQETGLLKRRTFTDAGSPWEGLNTPLQMDLVRIWQNRSKVAAADSDGAIPACPITFTEQEVQRRAALDESLREVDSELERINRILGIASDGWTPNDAREFPQLSNLFLSASYFLRPFVATMPGSKVGSKPQGKRPPNLWKQAYTALNDEEQGRERLAKLNTMLKGELGKPGIKLRTDDGYKQLLGMIQKKARRLENRKSMDKVARVCSNMMKFEDIVAAGAGVGGPYVAIPAAALFSVFAMNEIYLAERAAMYEVAETVADYVVMNRKAHEWTTIQESDDRDMHELKESLQAVFASLYKAIIFATAQLMISLNGNFQWIKGVAKHYDWEGQLANLNKCQNRISQFMHSKEWQEAMNPSPANKQPSPRDLKKIMGPGPRNPLHWAAALGVPEQVAFYIQNKEYPVNALTPQSWTAAHLAAREGHTKILRMLFTAPDIDLFIKNREHRTPLHVAAFHDRRFATRALLERSPRLLASRDKWDRTAFIIAVEKGHPRVLDVLKAFGQDVNETTLKNGWSGLHLAAENGSVDVVKWLLANGAKRGLKIRDGAHKGLTARQVAEKKGRTKVLEVLDA